MRPAAAPVLCGKNDPPPEFFGRGVVFLKLPSD